jgi:hypothetical protein
VRDSPRTAAKCGSSRVASFAPIGVAFQGPNLGVGAFRVDAVTSSSGSTTAKHLPRLSVTIVDVMP